MGRWNHWSFLKNENDERQKDIIADYFVLKLNEMLTEGIFFQQESATYHTVRQTITLLKKHLVNALFLT